MQLPCTEPVAKGEIQLDPSNYWTLTHLLSFLVIKEETALIVDVGVQEELEIALILDGSAQVHLIDFRYTRSVRKRQRVHSNAFRP